MQGVVEGYIIRIKNINEIYSWWPKLCYFLFGSTPVMQLSCYVLNLSPDFEKARVMSQMFKQGISDIGVRAAEVMSDANFVVCFSKDGTIDPASPEFEALRLSKMLDHPVHGNILRGTETQ